MPAVETKPQPILRKDYAPSNHLIDRVELRFELGDEETLVHARLELRRNPAGVAGAPLVLHGEELELRALALDGEALGAERYSTDDEHLTLPDVPDACVLESTVAIRPQDNTRLMGLYRSGSAFCTQCEAEGFRRITYFLDRPDVMARYRVRLEADKASCPVLLSNGNRVEAGELEGGRHFVQWEDPFPKPSYLFAIVAGDLHCHGGSFTARSGRELRLEVWVEHQNADRCDHALLAMQQAMKWDEDVFGLEYDLDLYMIVAVSDFNMGAMENKGLNIFNSKYVLAKPETATDDDYEGIQGVIGHEYFHNWTGNRVTCRDWFQLTLKEGLTVFRDQQFTADMTSPVVKRIADVDALRTFQFAEDAGPMAHPIRPESYIEMNNFYTLTVYEKGAEVIRMVHTLLGPDGFRKGMDLYFERHDGQAVTCDDFRAAMAYAGGRDLAQFERWYDQAGTPELKVRATHDAANGTYTLAFEQVLPVLPDQASPRPYHVPVRLGLLGPDGADLPLTLAGEASRTETTRVVELTEREQSFTFTGIQEPPVPSLLRGFSAPVRLSMERPLSELTFLLAHDSDAFNRREAGQQLARRTLLELAATAQAGAALELSDEFVQAFGRVLADESLDGSLRAQTLALPSEKFLAQEMEVIDPDALHTARQFVRARLGAGLAAAWRATYDRLDTGAPYANDGASIDARRLKNCALAYLVAGEVDGAVELARRQFDHCDNMTDAQAAMAVLNNVAGADREEVLAAFHRRWKDDPLVLDKWFMVQAVSSLPDAVERVVALSEHPDFTLDNPNRARSLVGAFGNGNQVRFHDPQGRGYAFVADKVLELDAKNPQVASRVVSCFNLWKRLDPARQGLMKGHLERIAGSEKLSKDVYEIVTRSLER